jgi:hypothetical protein
MLSALKKPMMPLKLLSPISGKPMEQVALECGLEAHRCVDSGGHYIQAQAYLIWLQQQPARLPHLPAAAQIEETSTNPEKPRMCPESGTIMSRYKIGHGFTFSIDRSITGGVWLDGGEWEALRQRNFHEEIHLIFTAPWQKQVRLAHAQATYKATLESAFGSDLLNRLSLLRAELLDHPQHNLAIAYLAEKENSLGPSDGE